MRGRRDRSTRIRQGAVGHRPIACRRARRARRSLGSGRTVPAGQCFLLGAGRGDCPLRQCFCVLGRVGAGGLLVAGRRGLLLAALLAGSFRPPLLRATKELGRAAALRRKIAWTLGLAVGGLAVGMGLAGLLLHLQSSFFQEQTLRNLVYAAFTAPLSYAGLGLLAILNRTVPSRSVDWARWVILLALGGFLGNFVLSLTDHAQNGFFDGREWIAVVAAAFAVGELWRRGGIQRSPLTSGFANCLMLVEIGVGLLGWYCHLRAILRSPMSAAWDKIVLRHTLFARSCSLISPSWPYWGFGGCCVSKRSPGTGCVISGPDAPGPGKACRSLPSGRRERQQLALHRTFRHPVKAKRPGARIRPNQTGYDPVRSHPSLRPTASDGTFSGRIREMTRLA